MNKYNTVNKGYNKYTVLQGVNERESPQTLTKPKGSSTISTSGTTGKQLSYS